MLVEIGQRLGTRKFDLSIATCSDTLLSREIFSLRTIFVVKNQCKVIRREMDNVETGLSVKVIEEVDEPTGSPLMLLMRRAGKSPAGKLTFFLDRERRGIIKKKNYPGNNVRLRSTR